MFFYFICAWIHGWVNNREAGDLRRHRAHYDVIVMGIFRHWSIIIVVYYIRYDLLTRDSRHATATTTLFATHVFLCLCSVRRNKRQVAGDLSLATIWIATCSDRPRLFTKSRDIVTSSALKNRSLNSRHLLIPLVSSAWSAWPMQNAGEFHLSRGRNIGSSWTAESLLVWCERF